MTARASLARKRLGISVALILWAPLALAQAVEKHPAPILHGTGATRLDAGALLQGSTDATPFGVGLSGIMLVDAHENGAARAKTGPGVDIAQAGPTARGIAAKLSPFVGQPLSYKLISEIEAAVTQHYRENGRSLVLVTVPPQEITTGVLQVNVNTFRLEAPPVLAGDATDGDHVTRQIRLRPGQEVDTAKLMDDVTWLNLNPFRKVAVAFEPGQTADGTRLTLQVQSKRPWSAYAGASNAGAEGTGALRVFGGFNVSALPWKDQQLSYQINLAPSPGGLWDTEGTKGYVSHGLSYFVPVTLNNGFRFKATAGLTHASSFAVPDAVFSTGTTTDGASLELAFPLPRKSGTWALVPELYLGLAQDDYSRRQYFGGAVFATEASKLTRVTLGLRSSLNGRLFGRPTHGDLDLSLVAGRQEGATDSDFSYAKFRVGQEISLEGGAQVALRLGGQYSPGKLHPLEQLGLGGESTVRGYGANAVSSQSAVSLSVEYRLTPIDVPMGGKTGQLRPHVFADWGYADATDTTPSAHLAGIGLGGALSVGEDWEAAFTLANALNDAGSVQAGDVSVALRLIARF